MKVTGILAVGVLTFCLCGCEESNNSNKTGAQGRTGSTGITSQGIDDLAKPDAKPNDANAPAGKTTP